MLYSKAQFKKIEMTQTITVKDVARKAKVSVGTVSRVLNRAENIHPENISRVENAVKILGYRKCNAAQLLVSHKNSSSVRTGNIGLVFSELNATWRGRPHLACYTKGVERACREHGYHAIIEWAGDADEGVLPACVREGKIDGVIIKSLTVDYKKYENLPVVGLSDDMAPIRHVAPDNRNAGRYITEYLWNKGHRRISFISNASNHPMFIKRYQGYEEFLRKNNAFYPDLVKVYDDHILSNKPQQSFPDMSIPLKKLLTLPQQEQPTAIITANDWIAGGVYAALHQLNISIPDQISVIGFDNLDTLCCSLFPTLTSYAIPFEKIAYIAAKTLLALINNPSSEQRASIELVQGELIERESVRTLK